ncbi:hypothetical protein NCS57_00983400 [Fusarium keratoplasticum]|uniref:Uncharacterized protein n=1 Tax=Fusarium keratoplasticum TaxID=1328300 RepID=A0ACC0QLA6_9HYPO|nr:hypothetical protein NCS57_00983400 [Fusarium keratoplasticum]KAI8660070.1 hypothetical protein NCS57_00983400 [Fusarium keratoplasticum]
MTGSPDTMSSIPNQPKIDVSVDEDFGAHSVSQIIGRRRNKASAKKQQPWEHSYVVNPADPTTTTRGLDQLHQIFGRDIESNCSHM